MLPPSRPQNGMFNFQHGFSMQAMGNHGNPMTPHSVAAVTPHMSNFALGNFLSDSGDSALNMSPIKFTHHHPAANPMLAPHPHHAHQAGMDPNQYHQYHNARAHHAQPQFMSNAMALNSILSQHPHNAMGQGGPSFHSPHPSSFMPPLNFSHEH
jgi:hypothetical protein